MHMPRWIYVVILAWAAAGAVVAKEPPTTTSSVGPVTFNIPSQPLEQALNEFSRQTHLRVSFYGTLSNGLTSPPIAGSFTPEAALKLLLKDTGLRFEYLDAASIAILPPEQPVGATTSQAGPLTRDGDPGRQTDITLAQNRRSGDESDSRSVENASRATDVDSRKNSADVLEQGELEQILVTGTHIRGAEPTSRVDIYTRAEIETMGFGSVAEFFRTLPQNLNSASPTTIASVAGLNPAGNNVGASSISLRGLGNGATLILLNGQRVAPGNSTGNIVDVSLIPLSAVERVEVIYDGASAIYGSDAVGGVVNFVLRSNLEGAETQLRYGAVTEGSREQYRASQTFGHTWESGSALLSYEYSADTPLYAKDRDYTKTTPNPFDLLPAQKVNGVLLTAKQNLPSGWSMFGNATFASRSGESDFTLPPTEGTSENIDAYTLNGGVRKEVFQNTQFELSSNYAHSLTNLVSLLPLDVGTQVANARDDTSIWSVDAKLDGSLLTIPAGKVLYAIGGQFRRETYTNLDRLAPSSDFSNSRHITAAFAELHVPLLGRADADSKNGRLELQIADRFERYSDFGTTNNPQIGLVLQVVRELKIHAAYSTSFVAPSLADLNPTPSQVTAFPGFLFGPSDPNALLEFGGNPNLTAQTSRNWSLGAQFNGQDGLGLSSYLDYYHISYKNQISNIQGLIFLGSAFQYANVFGPTLINFHPSASVVQGLVAQPSFTNPFGLSDLSSVALIDSRKQNLSVVSTSGLDFGLAYKSSTPIGENEAGLDGVYILAYDNQITPLAPETSFLNRPFNPIGLKARGRDSLRWGPITASALVNFTKGYQNPIGGTTMPVASWTTLDMTLAYAFSQSAGLLKRTHIMVGATNLLDRAPPHVTSGTSFTTLNYDGVNANPLGRFVFVQLEKGW